MRLLAAKGERAGQPQKNQRSRTEQPGVARPGEKGSGSSEGRMDGIHDRILEAEVGAPRRGARRQKVLETWNQKRPLRSGADVASVSPILRA